MNAISLAGQKVHDVYTGFGNTAPVGPCVVAYSLSSTGKVKSVSFSRTGDAEVLATFLLTDSLTEQQWLAQRTLPNGDPLYMNPVKVDAVDALGTITCTAEQYQALVGCFDENAYFHALKQTDRIDKAAMAVGGRITLKAIISDEPTESWWLTQVCAASMRVDNLTFDTP